MDGSARQQAYDRGHTIFSPDGRLYQVEYAREAVERGSPSVGVRADDGVVLAAYGRRRSPLLEADSIEKIHRVDDHVAIASAGHAADARRLVDVAREAGQRHRLRYGEPIPVASLTTALADHVQEYTQTGGSRPYGAALLVGGLDPEPGAGTDAGRDEGAVPRLSEVDPSGTPYDWRAVAIGDGSGEIRRSLEDALADEPDAETDRTGGDDGLPLASGIAVALEVLAATTDEALAVGSLDVHTVTTGDGVARLPDDRIETILEAGGAAS